MVPHLLWEPIVRILVQWTPAPVPGVHPSLVTPSIPTALFLSIFEWQSFSISMLIKCPMDVNTMSGFSLDSCVILASFVAISYLLLCVANVSPLSLFRMAVGRGFPTFSTSLHRLYLYGLPDFIGTIRPSDCLHTICLTRFLLVLAYHLYITAPTHFYWADMGHTGPLHSTPNNCVT